MTHLSPVSTVQLSRPICRYIREYIGTVCCSVCACVFPCSTFITPIARDPLFGLLHNRRRQWLRATYTHTHTHTHIMRVKMEPNQRGYTVYTIHTQTLIQSGFLCFINPPPPSLAIEPKRARETLATEKKKGGKNNPEDYCCGRHPFLSVRKIAPRERDPLPRRGRRPRDDRGVWSLLVAYHNACVYVCVTSEGEMENYCSRNPIDRIYRLHF
uniref:Uncharacterized protein n=1 Tax=Schizaphis graminum TaxID=13262 RepID=A0A2S2PQW4_SCHGA